MEKQYFISNDGQEVNASDLNTLGEMAGLMDDRVFAELFHPGPPGWPSSSSGKYILPSADIANGNPGRYTEVVVAPAALGTVAVAPFRAVIGSRVAYATSGKQYQQEIRSAIFASSTSSYYHSVSLTANSSGNARIDLIYAAITPDANSAGVSRKIKNPGTGVVTPSTISVTKTTNVSVGVITGTPSATPVVPTLTADGGGTYYIALAYVRVPDGFTASSSVAAADVINIAQCLPISPMTGAHVSRPASANLGTAFSAAQLAAWANGGAKPNYTLPSTMVGEETIWLAIDCSDASSANWSHADLAALDNSRDWRNRVFKWEVWSTVGAVGAGGFSFSSSSPAAMPDGFNTGGTPLQALTSGFGQSSYVDAGATGLEANSRCVAWLHFSGGGAGNMPVWTSAHPGSIFIYVDNSGVLKWKVVTNPQVRMLIRLVVSPAISN